MLRSLRSFSKHYYLVAVQVRQNDFFDICITFDLKFCILCLFVCYSYLESAKTLLHEQRKQMLQKYKEEKQLQKLKEQREKAKRGVFKVGLYRPDVPSFLFSNRNPTKAEPIKVNLVS